MPPLDETETPPEGEGAGNGDDATLLPNSVSLRERVQHAQTELDRIDLLRNDLTDERNDLISGLKEHGVDVAALKIARRIKRDHGENRFDAISHSENITEYLEYLYPQQEMDV